VNFQLTLLRHIPENIILPSYHCEELEFRWNSAYSVDHFCVTGERSMILTLTAVTYWQMWKIGDHWLPVCVGVNICRVTCPDIVWKHSWAVPPHPNRIIPLPLSDVTTFLSPESDYANTVTELIQEDKRISVIFVENSTEILITCHYFGIFLN
jgi:hypothetical protein